MRKILLLLVIVVLSCGCVSFRSGSLPRNLNEKIAINKNYHKRDVSFSVSYYQQVGGDIIVSKKSLNNTIKDSFKKSKLFKRIYSTTFSDKSNYHYHFDLKITGTSYEDQQAKGFLMGYTLFTIPIWNNFYIDMTMYLFVDGKEVYSATTSERVTDLVWLPFAVTWIFANHATMGSYIRKHSLKYFISEIKKNNLYAIPTADNSYTERPKSLNFLDKENDKTESTQEVTDLEVNN